MQSHRTIIRNPVDWASIAVATVVLIAIPQVSNAQASKIYASDLGPSKLQVAGLVTADSDDAGRAPIADLVASPTELCSDRSNAMGIELDASLTSFPTGGPATWSWTVPPGHTYVGSGPVVTWLVPAGSVGPFIAEVEVEDTNGGIDTAQVMIDVFDPPTASLQIGPASVCIDMSSTTLLSLDASTSTPGSTAVLPDPGGYSWSSTQGATGGGSGSVEFLAVPAGVFGTVDVTVVVVDSNGCIDSTVQQAVLLAPPTVDLVASPTELCSDPQLGGLVNLDGNGTQFPGGPPSTWNWTVPFSYQGAGPIVDWMIPAGVSGMFTAHLEVVTVGGCTGFATVDVNVIADSIPPALGNVLLQVKTGTTGIAHHWRDLLDTLGDYQVMTLPASLGPPDGAGFVSNASVSASAAPGLQSAIDSDGMVDPAESLVFHRVRGTSNCGGRPGPVD